MSEQPTGPRKRVQELTREVNRLRRESERRATQLTDALDQLGLQVAALEQRLEDVRVRIETPPAPAPGEAAEAGSLLKVLRREHAQVRARLSALTAYEERLRRVEAASVGEAGQ